MKKYHTARDAAAIFCLLACASATALDKQFWYRETQKELAESLKKQPNLNTNVAKNIILAIGDGMGITTTTAARVYRGQQTEGLLGEEALLSWDKFPYTGLSKTYNTNQMTTDSAASANAYLCGVKTKHQAVGVDNNVVIKDCSTVESSKVDSILDWSLLEGKSVGIVTTDAVIGGSPAPAYAHSAYRKWSVDSDLPEDARGVCKDLARQLVEDNLDIQVILGGGRVYFLPNTTTDVERTNVTGKRTDGIDLMQKWKDLQTEMGRKPTLVMTKSEFDAVDPEKVDYLMGLFEPKRMEEEADRRINDSEPSLSDLVDKAVDILSKNPNGYFLFVEGANIDRGHHENRPRKAIMETLALDDAVAKLVEKTSEEETLIVVSADHDHAFTFGGYAKRGSNILSIADSDLPDKDTDKLNNSYTILSYGNGPGYSSAQRANLTHEMFETDQVYMSNFPLEKETHGGSDVAIYASGPMAHLFTGTHEQTFIAHGMAYAACVGENRDHCDNATPNSSNGLPILLSEITVLFWVVVSCVIL